MLSLPRKGGLRQVRQRRGVVARVAAASASVLFPPRCPVTGARVSEAGAFSARGWAQLTFLSEPACRLCGLPFDHAEPGLELCAACAAPEAYLRKLTGRRKLDAIRSVLVYDRVSAGLILSLKYADRHDLATALGRLLAGPIAALAPSPGSVLVPVPLHRRRLRSRRFNQSALLAGAASRASGLPVIPDLVRRPRATASQKGLGVEARFRNIAGAFSAMPAARGASVILVDDVLTSGATLVACARALRRAGAVSVKGVTIARALPNARDHDMEWDGV